MRNMARLCGCVLFVVCAGVCAGGCAGTAEHRAAAPVSDEAARRAAVFDGSDGSAAAWERVVAECAAAEVVLIGENHGHPLGLAWAAVLFEDVLGEAPDAALSLEFFERDDQSRVDDYLGGLTDEAAFRTRTQRTAGNYPEGHRRMLEAARAGARPVVASNTPWEVIRYLRGKTYAALDGLTAEQRRLFRVPDELAGGKYREDYDAIMSSMGASHGAAAAAHPAPEPTPEQRNARLDAGFRTQQLWDWTMAESVVRAVEAGNRPVVHVIGRFHSDFRGGTAQAIERLRPGTKVVVVSVVDEESARLKAEDRGRGDFVVYVGPAPGR